MSDAGHTVQAVNQSPAVELSLSIHIKATRRKETSGGYI